MILSGLDLCSPNLDKILLQRTQSYHFYCYVLNILMQRLIVLAEIDLLVTDMVKSLKYVAEKNICSNPRSRPLGNVFGSKR